MAALGAVGRLNNAHPHAGRSHFQLQHVLLCHNGFLQPVRRTGLRRAICQFFTLLLYTSCAGTQYFFAKKAGKRHCFPQYTTICRSFPERGREIPFVGCAEFLQEARREILQLLFPKSLATGAERWHNRTSAMCAAAACGREETKCPTESTFRPNTVAG